MKKINDYFIIPDFNNPIKPIIINAFNGEGNSEIHFIGSIYQGIESSAINLIPSFKPSGFGLLKNEMLQIVRKHMNTNVKIPLMFTVMVNLGI